MSCNQVWPPAATNVATAAGTNLSTNITGPVEEFGAVNVSEMTAVVQRSWIHSLQPQLDITVEHESATVNASYVTTEGYLRLQSGATASSRAYYRTHHTIPFDQGKTIASRFSVIFDTPTVDTTQIIGMGDADDALAFGANGSSFGVLHRSGGTMEVRKMQVTNGSTGAGSITITLDGEAIVLAMPATSSIAEIAHSIGIQAFGSVAGGWRALSQGDDVFFIALDTTTRSGTYSFVDTGGTGITASSPGQILTAVAATDVWIPQTSWNIDTADGTSTLPALTVTNGNIFEIQYQASGFGSALYRVMDPGTGKFVDVHRIEYANSNIGLFMNQPNLALYADLSNSPGDAGASLTMLISDMAGYRFSSVRRNTSNIRYAMESTKTVGTTSVLMLLLRNPVPVATDVRSHSLATVEKIILGNNASNKMVSGQIFINPRITGAPSWAAATGDSAVEQDTTATAATIGEGRQPITFTIGALQSNELSLSADEEIVLEPGDVMAVVMNQSAGGTGTAMIAGVVWNENR